MVTRVEAKEMRDEIRDLEKSEAQQVRNQENAKIQIALAWWNTVKPTVPTTRKKALDAFNSIKTLMEGETDNFRLALLRKKSIEANEKYKEIKRNG